MPIPLPLFETRISAGFPSSVDEQIERSLDLHEFLVKNPAATFFIRAQGDSMLNDGIRSGDLLVVDRSLPPQSGKIVIALLNGEFTVKRLLIKQKKIYLMPAHPDYKPLPVKEGSDFQVWGVVTYVIHRAD